MLIKEFSKYLERLEGISSRNSKTEILSELIKKLTADELKPAMYMLDGRVGPRFDPMEYNFSAKLMIRSFERLYDTDAGSLFKEKGDLGVVIEILNTNIDKGGIEITKIFEQLRMIAELEGKGSQEAKINNISELIANLDPLSSRYIVRMIIGSLRLGLNDKTVLDAISWALAGDKRHRDILDRAYGVRSDLGEILTIAITNGIEKLKDITIEVGMPLAAKLVEREKDTARIFERLGSCIIQPKYDGLRAQIHFKRSGLENTVKIHLSGDQPALDMGIKHQVAIFSRNMEDMTYMFPDIVAGITKLPVDSIVLDSEVIGYNPITDQFVPFQETIQRKRKHSVESKTKDIPIYVFTFDCLFINGEDISQKSLTYRIEKLREAIPVDNNLFKVSETIVTTSSEEIEAKWDEYIDQGLEGLIAKGLDTTYQPGTRNYDWIKLKATSKEGFVDTVDTVVLGYFKGRGQRTKFGIGALLLGVYDSDSQNYVSIAKLGTGIKDDQWPELKDLLDKNVSIHKPQSTIVEKILTPDVWLIPSLVLEVGYDEITKSQNHAAGKTDTESGYSLRFPRMKSIRKDKSAQQSTTVQEIKSMFRLNQKS